LHTNFTIIFNNAFGYFAGSYFQLIPLTIIQACIGSIAVYYILQWIPNLWDMFQLLCCVTATTMYLGAILAQIHVKKVFYIFIFGLMVNLILLTIQLAG
jgi:hypothetical protein